MTHTDSIARLLYVADGHFGNYIPFQMQPRKEGLFYGAFFTLGGYQSTLTPLFPTTLLPTYFSLPLPTKTATEIPNASTGELTLTLVTFSDAELTQPLGSESMTATAILDRSPDTLPSLSLTLHPYNPTLAPLFSDLYVQGITRVKAIYSATAKLGASITDQFLTVPDSEDDLVTTAGDVTIKATVLDSRGFSAIAEQTVSVLPYAPPELLPAEQSAQITLYRCDENGVKNQNGSHLRLAARARFSPLDDRNALSFAYRIKCENESFGEWTALSDIQNAILENAVPQTAKSYSLELSVTDLLENSHTVTLSVPAGAVTFHLGKSGTRAAFGKTAEIENALEISPLWQLFVGGYPVFDTVKAAYYDTENKVYIRLWKNGRCELFFDPLPFTPTDALQSGPLHIAQCRLTLPFAIAGATVTGSAESCLFMGGECYENELLFTVACGEVFDGTKQITLRLTVCGTTSN